MSDSSMSSSPDTDSDSLLSVIYFTLNIGPSSGEIEGKEILLVACFVLRFCHVSATNEIERTIARHVYQPVNFETLGSTFEYFRSRIQIVLNIASVRFTSISAVNTSVLCP